MVRFRRFKELNIGTRRHSNFVFVASTPAHECSEDFSAIIGKIWSSWFPPGGFFVGTRGSILGHYCPRGVQFFEVSKLFSSEPGIDLPYRAMPAFQWLFWALNNGLEPMEALVRAMLHALPKYGNTPPTSQNVRQVLKQKPGSLVDFLQREDTFFEPLK